MDAPSYTCFEDEENFFQEKYSLWTKNVLELT